MMGGIGVAALLKLLSIGAVLGLIPIIWVGYRGRGDAYRRLIWVTAFLTLDLIMFGGFTRLTDSGLGCPDWPGCYEQATPFHARDHIAAAQTADPYGPVTLDRAWIEMLHRYFAMAVGLLITAITVLAWWGRHRSDRPSPWYASFLLVLVCIQGAFGAWTVILKLQPVIVTLHLLFGMALLGGLTWLASLHRLPVALSLGRGAVDVPAALLLKGARPWYSRIRQYGLQRRFLGLRKEVSSQVSGLTRVQKEGVLRDFSGKSTLTLSSISAREMDRLRRLSTWALGVLVVQIALGGWVSSNYAVLACHDFPWCNGQWVPSMDFAQGFALWRELGKTAQGAIVTLDALVAIHWVHRCFAVLVLVVVSLLIWRIHKIALLRGLAYGLTGVMGVQLLTGVSNIVLQWPLFAALLHNGGAALLLILLVRIRVVLASNVFRVGVDE